jgi:hypothetical protein
MGPGSTWARQSAGRRWCGCFRLFCAADDDNRIYLVTPVEKIGIRVRGCAFRRCGDDGERRRECQQVLTFRTNVGDMWSVPGRPIRCRFVVTHGETEQLKPYVLVRGRLEALVNRAVTYDLLALGEAKWRSMAKRCLRFAPAGPCFRSWSMARAGGQAFEFRVHLRGSRALMPRDFRKRARKAMIPDHALRRRTRRISPMGITCSIRDLMVSGLDGMQSCVRLRCWCR